MTQLSIFTPPKHTDPCVGCVSAQAHEGRVYCAALVGSDVTRAQRAAAWVMAGMVGQCDSRREKR